MAERVERRIDKRGDGRDGKVEQPKEKKKRVRWHKRLSLGRPLSPQQIEKGVRDVCGLRAY